MAEQLGIEMDLRGNALTGEIPAELGRLSNLGWMFISDGNEFTGCVPDGLRDVIRIVTLPGWGCLFVRHGRGRGEYG